MNSADNWDLVITPKNKFFQFNLNQILEYKDLLFLFVKRDITSFYKQTILGPFWYIIQPIFTTIVFTFIFGNLAGIPTDGIPKPLFYLTGVTAWNYFADCFLKTSTTFRDNAGIYGKVYFPRLISPLSVVISSLLRFCIQILLLLIVIFYYYFIGYRFNIGWEILLFPIFILSMAMQGLGLGLLITAMTNKYKDLTYLVAFGVQLMMYSTTVIYPLSNLSGKMYWIVALNPMTFIIEGIRKSIIGIGFFNLYTFSYMIIISFFFFIFGLLLFNKVEKNFIDTV
jgi:lipopolysaccharide transport system permease protein